MAVADHTYSFRAPVALGDRLRAAELAYAELAADVDTAARISRDLEIGLQRRLREAGGERATQGRTLRGVVEAFVSAVEAAQRETGLAGELARFDAADTAGPSERSALLRRSPGAAQ